MADSRALLHGLENYHTGVLRHLETLSSDFSSLQGQWEPLNENFEGTSAEEFKEHWMQTTQMFDRYVERAREIAHVLAERVEQLREFDRAGVLN